MTDKHEKKWVERIESALLGRRINKIRYMSKEEADELDWHSRPVIIELDNGTALIPSMDDEGNDGGAIHTNLEELTVIPVF